MIGSMPDTPYGFREFGSWRRKPKTFELERAGREATTAGYPLSTAVATGQCNTLLLAQSSVCCIDRLRLATQSRH